MFLFFWASAVNASDQHCKHQDLTYTYISKFSAYIVIPETKPSQPSGYHASKQASKNKPARPCLTVSPCNQPTNPTNTHLPSQSEESVSSASDPASRLLQPGCNMNTRQQECTFITEGPPPLQTQHTFDDSRQSEGSQHKTTSPGGSTILGRTFRNLRSATKPSREMSLYFQTGPPMVTVWDHV